MQPVLDVEPKMMQAQAMVVINTNPLPAIAVKGPPAAGECSRPPRLGTARRQSMSGWQPEGLLHERHPLYSNFSEGDQICEEEEEYECGEERGDGESSIQKEMSSMLEQVMAPAS